MEDEIYILLTVIYEVKVKEGIEKDLNNILLEKKGKIENYAEVGKVIGRFTNVTKTNIVKEVMHEDIFDISEFNKVGFMYWIDFRIEKNNKEFVSSSLITLEDELEYPLN